MRWRWKECVCVHNHRRLSVKYILNTQTFCCTFCPVVQSFISMKFSLHPFHSLGRSSAFHFFFQSFLSVVKFVICNKHKTMQHQQWNHSIFWPELLHVRAKVTLPMAKIIGICINICIFRVQHFASLSCTVFAIYSKLSFYLQSVCAVISVERRHCWPSVDHTYHSLSLSLSFLDPFHPYPSLTFSFDFLSVPPNRSPSSPVLCHFNNLSTGIVHFHL